MVCPYLDLLSNGKRETHAIISLDLHGLFIAWQHSKI